MHRFGIRNNTHMVLKMYIIRYMVIRVYVMEGVLVFISMDDENQNRRPVLTSHDSGKTPSFGPKKDR